MLSMRNGSTSEEMVKFFNSSYDKTEMTLFDAMDKLEIVLSRDKTEITLISLLKDNCNKTKNLTNDGRNALHVYIIEDSFDAHMKNKVTPTPINT